MEPAFRANLDKMNMDNEKWIPGEDYNAAPTCATCHMSATRKQDVTHDVGNRISWNNRPPFLSVQKYLMPRWVWPVPVSAGKNVATI